MKRQGQSGYSRGGLCFRVVLLGKLGESHDSVLAEESGSLAVTASVTSISKEPAPRPAGRKDAQRTFPRRIPGPFPALLPRESPGSWSWQHLQGPEQRPRATPAFLSRRQLFLGTDTSPTEEAAAKGTARCQRGPTGKEAFGGSEGLGSRDSGQQAHPPVPGSRSGGTPHPAVPRWRLHSSCRGGGSLAAVTARRRDRCHPQALGSTSPDKPRRVSGAGGRPWKGKSRRMTGDRWPRAVTSSTSVH